MMILIIGGAYQGKLAYAKTLTKAVDSQIINGQTCPFDNLGEVKIIYNLHHLVGRCLQAKIDVNILLANLLTANPSLIIVCNEVGCGLVPADPWERSWREDTGRLCCSLAESASQVIRIFCGIPKVIKG